MEKTPPEKPLKFLRWFLKQEYLEEIEGDLVELFEKQVKQSSTKARRAFAWNVIRYFRPGFIRLFTRINYTITPAMLKSDLKISWRSLKKQPFFTFLNTFGLAIGIAGALLIFLYIQDELSYDTMFADADRIYRVNIENKVAGEVNNYAATPTPLATVIRQDFSQAERVTRFMNMGSVFLRQSDTELTIKENDVVAADSSFFEMFGIQLIEGDSKSALTNPNSLVLTKSAAREHFGSEEALGQSLIMDDGETFMVTGVINDLPENSFLRNERVFISLSGFEEAESTAWNNWNFPTFVKLMPSADPEYLEDFLSTVNERYLLPWAVRAYNINIQDYKASQEKTGNYMQFYSISLTDIHLYSPNISGEFSQNSDIQNVYILGFIGLFLVILAIVNFMNLSTAYSLKRAKEVGVRKTLGSDRFDLIRQFLIESTVVSCLSFLLAILLAYEVLPYFNALSDKAISIPFENPVFWILLISAAMILGLFSGSYPAFFMSSFIPSKVLKGNSQAKAGGGNLRNTLVVFQFSISIFLIVSTLVVFQQLSFMQNKDLGYQKDQVLVIDDVNTAGNKLQTFKEEVKKLGPVENASLSSFLPTPSARSGQTFFPEGKVLGSESAVIIQEWKVDYDYISTLDLDIVAGRDFDKGFGRDSSAIILNESTVEMLGMDPEEVIGLRLTKDFARPDKENMEFHTVIGVIRNFHYETMRNPIDGMSFTLGDNPNRMVVKLNAGDFSEAISATEYIWSDISPGQPMNYYFMDDSFNDVYQAEIRLGKVFLIFTVLSILISCLGLFGLATFDAERRIKEIGIRKVLGASVPQIISKLSVDFLKLVGIAILVALPLGWYAMNIWLQDFSYRIDIGPKVFLLAAGLAVLISILTISYQSIRAAVMNPIWSLRSE